MIRTRVKACFFILHLTLSSFLQLLGYSRRQTIFYFAWLDCAKSSKSLRPLVGRSILTENTVHLAAMGEHRTYGFFSEGDSIPSKPRLTTLAIWRKPNGIDDPEGFSRSK